jgi:transformation/transcription domain-associated protein
MANVFDDAVKRLSTPETGMLMVVPSKVGLWPNKGSPDRMFDADVKLKCDAATSLRDNLDHYTTGQNYLQFLKRVMPIFVHILRGPPIFQSNSNDQVHYWTFINFSFTLAYT